MSHLRASLYEHVAAARWRLLDQGFVSVSDGSDGARSVLVNGSSEFPASFSFSPGRCIVRVGSWFQWTQDIEGHAATFALRFGCSPDSEAFATSLPQVSIQACAPSHQAFHYSSDDDQTPSLKHSPSPPLPTHMHHLCSLSDDLHRIRTDCVSMSHAHSSVLEATISVVRAMSDYVTHAPVAASGVASKQTPRAAPVIAAASWHHA